MKKNLSRGAGLLYRTIIPCVVAWLLASVAGAQARTITLSLEFTSLQFNSGQPPWYTVKTLVSSDVPSVTYDEIDSSTNHSAFGGSETGYGYGYYSDIGSALNAATNGAWTLTVNKGDISEKQYTFTVSATGLLLDNSNFPAVEVTTPVDGNPAVSTNSAFAWTGPATWEELDLLAHTPDYSFYAPDSPSPATTSWSAAPLPLGTNVFEVTYKTNAAAWITISPPLDNLSHPFTNWVGGAKLADYAQSEFVTSTNPATLGGVHTLVAHYAFDDSGNYGLDSSGQGNDFSCGSGWGSGEVFSTDAIAGGGAMQFFGGSSMTPCGQNQAFTSWTNALAGSFTVSAWIKTTTVVGNDGDNLDDNNGQSVIYADNNNVGATPVALTGTKAAFRTTDPDGHDDTLHSLQSVTIGNYVHIVATRDQTTGEKKIYINGTLDNADFASTESLTGAGYISMGGEMLSAYNGLVDDVQIYSGVLSDREVANLYANPGATAPNVSVSSGGHLIVARFNFEDTNAPGMDSSGLGNDANCGGGDGTTNYPDIFSTDAAVGSHARDFLGHSFICFTPPAGSFTNLANALSGSFSVSAWVKTTQSVNDDNAPAEAGANILFAEDVNTNSTMPLALTGSKAAFSVNDHNGTTTTVHSLTSVNDGQYHQLAVTRNQASGQLKIYVDGNLEGSATGSTDPLYINSIIALGGYFNYYTGLLDDVQIYSGVLDEAEVAGLFANPGSTIPDVSGQDFNAVLGTTNLNWSTRGDTSWFVETTNTHNGAPAAAQSGSVIDSQSSTLYTTVTGPGTLTFCWSSIAEDPNNGFNYEFDMDGGWANNISGDTSWQAPQNGPFTIPAGTHTLSWTVTANGDTDPTQAGFLDQVSYVPATLPIITVNPFNQTNYPGYKVALLAAAATNTTVTWQWFKVGSAGPISNATSALFIPTNSGTVGVAGSYYAMASNLSGSANTTTAAVTFVSAALPPDWSVAFKSPFRPMDDTTVTKDYYYGCITDTNGNIYAAAVFDGNMMMTNGITNMDSGPGGDGAAVVKQSSTGVPLWAVAITNNGSGSARAYCVAPAPGGGVYMSGDYSGTNWLGANQFTDAGNGDIFIARFDANGSNLWLKTFGGTNTDFLVLNTLIADPAGDVTIAGLLGSGPVSIGSSNYNVVGQEGVVIQLDQTGAVRWSELLPAEQVQHLTYSANRIYASVSTATSGGTTNVVIGGVSNPTDRAWAIACLNGTNGQAIWVRGVGAIYGSANGNPLNTGLLDDPPRLAVSGTNVFLTGVAYDSTASFGALTVNFGDGRGQYFARYDTNGNAQVATTYGSVTTTPFAAVADANGDLYVSGDFDTCSVFGNDIIATPVATRPFNGLYFSQAFIAKFDLNGNPLWAREAVVSLYGTVNCEGIALASDGVWASGWGLCGYYPATVPVIFGTHTVNSDVQYVSGGVGSGENTIFYPGGMLAKVTDSVVAAAPVLLFNPSNTGANFQFQFLSESGFNHNILYRTNLATGAWLTNSTVSGDGTVKTISLPYSLFSPSTQGFIRVSTQ